MGPVGAGQGDGMRTRVGAWCERIIEAGWLVALIVVPLFFNLYSSRVFEPDKLALLRTIATVMAATWLIKVIDEGRVAAETQGERLSRGLGMALRTPLVAPMVALAAVYLLATALSVVPSVSLWGSYQRLQGTYSTLSYMVIALLMIGTMRRREQWRRVVTVIILTSLPIALYGVAQHYSLDPLPWGGDVTTRVAANMGNAIFVAAYLIMVVPLTLARIIGLQGAVLAQLGEVEATSTPRVWRRFGLGLLFWVAVAVQLLAWVLLGMERGLAVGLLLIAALALAAGYLRRPMAPFVLAGSYALVLCAQLACILFSQSRGPWLGLVAGLFFFGLLYLFSQGRRRAAVAFTGMAGALVVFLLLINLPGTPLAAVRDLPYVGRLGQVFEMESGTGKVRVLIWEGALEMICADPLRAIIGYGPEAMYVAYNPFYPPDLAHYESRSASPDRAHNETFDALITTGVIGFVAYMLLFGSVFYYGLRWLGLIRGPTQRRLFLILAVAGGVLGVVVPWALEGTLRLAGVGLPLGFVAGVALYMAATAILGMTGRQPEAPREEGRGSPDRLVMAAILAAIVAHFVEIHFGIAIAATRTYFWSYLALMTLAGQRLLTADAPTEEAIAAREAIRGKGARGARRDGRQRDRRRRE